jgi:hypothetical protein
MTFYPRHNVTIPAEWLFENGDGASFTSPDPQRPSLRPKAGLASLNNTPIDAFDARQTFSVKNGPESSLGQPIFNEPSSYVDFLPDFDMGFLPNPGEDGLFSSEGVSLLLRILCFISSTVSIYSLAEYLTGH